MCAKVSGLVISTFSHASKGHKIVLKPAPKFSRTSKLSMQTTPIDNTPRKKVVVLGGDGFCGWPTSLYLSDQGHDIVIVDNLSRRKIDVELGLGLEAIGQFARRQIQR